MDDSDSMRRWNRQCWAGMGAMAVFFTPVFIVAGLERFDFIETQDMIDFLLPSSIPVGAFFAFIAYHALKPR